MLCRPKPVELLQGAARQPLHIKALDEEVWDARRTPGGQQALMPILTPAYPSTNTTHSMPARHAPLPAPPGLAWLPYQSSSFAS